MDFVQLPTVFNLSVLLHCLPSGVTLDFYFRFVNLHCLCGVNVSSFKSCCIEKSCQTRIHTDFIVHGFEKTRQQDTAVKMADNYLGESVETTAHACLIHCCLGVVDIYSFYDYCLLLE